MKFKTSTFKTPLSPLVLAIVAASTSLGAQAADTEIVVAKPLPANTEPSDSLKGTFIQRMKAATNDTASLLSEIPGVSVNQAGGVSSLPVIRGLADDRLRVKVEGMDLIASCPNHMNPPLSYLDPSYLGELEVFAGITPVSVGGDSIGGTIVANKPEPEFALPGEGSVTSGEIGAFYRSNNSAFGANTTLNYATESFSATYQGSTSKADNYTAGGDFKTSTDTGVMGHALPLDEVGSTAYETRNHNLDLAVRAGRSLFEAQLSAQDMPEQLYPNQRMDLLDNQQRAINLSMTTEYDWGNLEARVYRETVDHFMDFGADKQFYYPDGTPCTYNPAMPMACAEGMPMYSESSTNGLSLGAERQVSEASLVRLGAELQQYTLDDYWTPSGRGMHPLTFLNINNGERGRAGIYAEVETQQNERWLTLFGVRYERVTTDADEVHGYKSALVGGYDPGMQVADAAAFNALNRKQVDDNIDLTALANYRYSDSLDIEMGLARKVRSPNLYERYTWSTWSMASVMNNFVGDGNGYVGDVDLKPEVAYTASASFNWHAPDQSWSFTASPYLTYVDNYIDAVATGTWNEDSFNVLQYANQSARLYGLDLSTEIGLGSNALGDWSLTGLVNYTQGENLDSNDDLYNIMPLNGRFALNQQRGGWDNALELILVDAKKDLSDIRNELPTSGYGLINLRTSYSWSSLRLDFGVENLFDRYYEMPTGGSYFGQGKTMSKDAGVPWGTAVPGMGRSIYLGMTMNF